MIVTVSRALVALAAHGMGEERREWGLAMEAEFETALDDGCAFSFAVGCLLASWRQLPGSEEGRFSLASLLVVVGVPLPLAATLIRQALTDRIVAPDPANLCALPCLAAVSLLLASGHVRLAWLMLDRDWERAARLGMLNAAASITLVTATGAMLRCDAGLLLDTALTALALAAVALLAQWHGSLPTRSIRRSSA